MSLGLTKVDPSRWPDSDSGRSTDQVTPLDHSMSIHRYDCWNDPFDVEMLIYVPGVHILMSGSVPIRLDILENLKWNTAEH